MPGEPWVWIQDPYSASILEGVKHFLLCLQSLETKPRFLSCFKASADEAESSKSGKTVYTRPFPNVPSLGETLIPVTGLESYRHP